MTLTICSLPTFTKFYVLAEHTRRKLIQYKYSEATAVTSKLWNKRCLPPLRTVDMRALGVAN